MRIEACCVEYYTKSCNAPAPYFISVISDINKLREDGTHFRVLNFAYCPDPSQKMRVV